MARARRVATTVARQAGDAAQRVPEVIGNLVDRVT
jgi:hypothetical protein